jgi:hypothetical protein
MTSLLRWFMGLFPGRVRVVAEGKGYRVGDAWYASQVEVRRHLESLGVPESEILRILRDLNREKYGDPQR